MVQSDKTVPFGSKYSHCNLDRYQNHKRGWILYRLISSYSNWGHEKWTGSFWAQGWPQMALRCVAFWKSGECVGEDDCDDLESFFSHCTELIVVSNITYVSIALIIIMLHGRKLSNRSMSGWLRVGEADYSPEKHSSISQSTQLRCNKAGLLWEYYQEDYQISENSETLQLNLK